MKMRKIVLILIVALFATSLLIAGGQQDMEGKTVVKFWRHQSPNFNKGYDILAEDYMAANPDIAIVFEDFDYDTYVQTLQTAFPSGTEADVMSMFGNWVFTYSDRLAEVPASLVSPDQIDDLFVASTAGGYVVDGKMYGIPQETNIEYGAVLVNTAIAKEVGADVSGFDNWDDFIIEMKKMTLIEEGIMNRAGYAFSFSDGIAYSLLSLINQFGGSHINAAGDAFTFDSAETRSALKLMKRFVDEGLEDPLLFNEESNWVGDGLFNEVIGAGLVGPWVVGDYAGDFPELVKVMKYVAMPSVSDTPAYTAAAGWGLTVSANSEVSDAAWDVVNYFTLNAENALIWNTASGTIPALNANLTGTAKEELLSAVPYIEPFINILPYGKYQQHMPDSDLIVYDIIQNYVLQYLQGNMSLEDTVSGIQSDSQGTF